MVNTIDRKRRLLSIVLTIDAALKDNCIDLKRRKKKSFPQLYKAVNMGTFYIITVFLPISQTFLKILKKYFGDFFGKNTLRKYSFKLG